MNNLAIIEIICVIIQIICLVLQITNVVKTSILSIICIICTTFCAILGLVYMSPFVTICFLFSSVLYVIIYNQTKLYGD